MTLLPAHAPGSSHLLVIGYGNELRSDDGAGPKLARQIEQQQFPNVRVLTAHQLTPELVEQISAASAVVFIDATAGAAEGVEVTRIGPATLARFDPHRSDPGLLVELAGKLYGQQPIAWSLAVPAAEFGFGEQLSDLGQRGMVAGLAAFRELWKTFDDAGQKSCFAS